LLVSCRDDFVQCYSKVQIKTIVNQYFVSGHKKCSGIKGSMYKVMKSFICRGCMNPVIGTGRTSVDIGGDANLELVDKFSLASVKSRLVLPFWYWPTRVVLDRIQRAVKWL